jgi:hypothetical protein
VRRSTKCASQKNKKKAIEGTAKVKKDLFVEPNWGQIY